MTDSDIKSPAFRLAELRSECVRVIVLLSALGSLLALVLIRGMASLAEGRRGEAWPYAVLLVVMALYEVAWLVHVRKAIASGPEMSWPMWAANSFVESLLPTAALFLQTRTLSVGPSGALTSPVILAYFLSIILSTLHLSPTLSRLAGGFAAAGYAVVSIYTFAAFPSGVGLSTYSTAFSYTAFLVLGGFAAGSVAHQIRLYVVAALGEAEARAKVAALEHDLGIARSIQQGLLPTASPKIEGFDIAGWNRPADETGGDYFDWQQLADGKFSVTVADVTGHGIGPALCMAACRAYARAVLATQTDLRTFLCRLNKLLYEDLPAERFVTLAAGVLNPADATLELISAGHGPVIFYSSLEDRFTSFDAQGPPLGLLPVIGYCGPRKLAFSRGDILMLVTDGFVEWVNARDEDFGESRLEEAIWACRHQSAAAIISALHSRVVEFAGSVPQADDLTALVVKRV